MIGEEKDEGGRKGGQDVPSFLWMSSSSTSWSSSLGPEPSMPRASTRSLMPK